MVNEFQEIGERDSATGDKIAGHAVFTLLGTTLGAAIVFLNEVLAARLLGVELYGLFALAFVVVKICEVVSSFGLKAGVLHYVPIYIEAGRVSQVVGAVLGALALPLALGSGLAGLAWLSSDWLALNVFSEPLAAVYIRYLALAIPFLALTDVLGSIGRAFGRSIEQVAVRNVLPPLAFTFSIVVLAAIDVPVIWITVGFALSYLLATVVGCGLVARLLGSEGRRTKPSAALRDLWAYSFPVLLNSILLLLVGWTDIFMIGIYTSADQVGIYRACMQIDQVFNLIFFALVAAAAPLYSVLIKGGELEALQRIYRMTLRWVAILTVPMLLLVAFNSGDILALLGPDFRDGQTALWIRALGRAIRTSVGLAGIVLLLGGWPKVELLNAALVVGLNVALNLALIPRYGIVGGATATAVSFAVISIVRVRQVRALLGLRTLETFMLRVPLVAGAAAMATASAAAAMGFGVGSGFGVFAFRLAVMATLVGAALWILGVDKDTKHALSEMLRRRFAGS